jgi:hypothetical protein
MMKAMALLPFSSLAVTCLPIKASLFKEPQRPCTVTVHARVPDIHRWCQRPLDGRLRPGGVPLGQSVGERRCWLASGRASRR